MKNLFYLLAFSMFSIAVLNLSSCSDKPSCDDVACLNDGTCSEGECICINGFTGANCELSPCDGVVCQNQGYCQDGTCECAYGYSGEFCDVETRTLYYGTFTAQNNCTDGNMETYTARIQIPSTNIGSFFISNFHDFESNGVSPTEADIYVQINTNGEGLNINFNGVDNNAYYVSGTATAIVDGVFTLNTNIENNQTGEVVSCSTTFTRQ